MVVEVTYGQRIFCFFCAKVRSWDSFLREDQPPGEHAPGRAAAPPARWRPVASRAQRPLLRRRRLADVPLEAQRRTRPADRARPGRARRLRRVRGGRRSGLVKLSSATRFAGIDIGATSVDVAVTDGELKVLGHVSEPIDIRSGPGPVLDRALDLVGKLQGAGPLHAAQRGRCGGFPGR